MNQEIDNKKQKARLALIMKTSKLRLWFYDPTTRHCCYLSEAGPISPFSFIATTSTGCAR